MVSGDIHNYKSNKVYYSAPPVQAALQSKRFSDSPSLRPWPPMYKSTSNRSPNGGNHMSKLNFNNINNGLYSGNSSVYGGRSKFNFHPLNGGQQGSNGKYSSSINLTNIKNAKNYYLVSQPYMKNSMLLPPTQTPYYGRDGNMLLMEKESQASPQNEKGHFRKLRHPTQQSPPQRGSCACIRSKSMEDVRTEIVTDWKAYNNSNDSFQHLGGMLRNGLGSTKSSTRRSMDNLLDVDAVYRKHFQVKSTLNWNCP